MEQCPMLKEGTAGLSLDVGAEGDGAYEEDPSVSTSRIEIQEKYLDLFVRLLDADDRQEAVDIEQDGTDDMDILMGQFDIEIGEYFSALKKRGEQGEAQLEYITARCGRSVAMAAVFRAAGDLVTTARTQELKVGQQEDEFNYFCNPDAADRLNARYADHSEAFAALVGGWYKEALTELMEDPRHQRLFAWFQKTHDKYYSALHNSLEVETRLSSMNIPDDGPKYIPPSKRTPDALMPRTMLQEILQGLDEVTTATRRVLQIFHDAVRPVMESAFEEHQRQTKGSEEFFDDTEDQLKRHLAAEMGDAALANVLSLLPPATTDAVTMGKVLSDEDPMTVQIELYGDPLQVNAIEVTWHSGLLQGSNGWSRAAYCAGLLAATAAPGTRPFIEQLAGYALSNKEAKRLEPATKRHNGVLIFMLLGAWAARVTIFNQRPTIAIPFADGP
jgi:hypothetical protein